MTQIVDRHDPHRTPQPLVRTRVGRLRRFEKGFVWEDEVLLRMQRLTPELRPPQQSGRCPTIINSSKSTKGGRPLNTLVERLGPGLAQLPTSTVTRTVAGCVRETWVPSAGCADPCASRAENVYPTPPCFSPFQLDFHIHT